MNCKTFYMEIQNYTVQTIKLNHENHKSIRENEIIVSYKGLLPNLFSEGKGVVAEGKLRDKKYFIADKILAKHDENYMPPEVKKAMEKSN